MKKLAMVLIALALSWGTAGAFTKVTKLGITVTAADSTMAQYNAHWKKLWPTTTGTNIGPKWIYINWNALDIQYMELSKAYGITRDPRFLRIVIMPLDYSCTDESSAPYNYEFSCPDYACIDGMQDGSTIYIHLGDDPAQFWSKMIGGLKYTWDRPFCYTAYSHELCHWFKGNGLVECPNEITPPMCQ